MLFAILLGLWLFAVEVKHDLNQKRADEMVNSREEPLRLVENV